jgi:hypothetical protein
MSGRISTLKSKRRNRKLQLLDSIAAARASKKAKLSQDVIPCTPETTVHLEPQLFCATCSSQKFIDTNQLTIKQWQAVDEVKLGRDSKKDSVYQYVLGMLPEDMIHMISHRLSMDIRNGNEKVTLNQADYYKTCSPKKAKLSDVLISETFLKSEFEYHKLRVKDM